MNQREYDAAVAIVKANPVVGKLIDTLMEKLADLETRLAQAETTKARGTTPTVADASGDVIQKDLARRQSTQIRKSRTTSADLSDYDLSLKRRVRDEERAAEAERIATEGIRATAEALRKKAAGR